MTWLRKLLPSFLYTTLMTGVDPDPLIAAAGKMLDNTRQQDELGFYSKALDEINKISLNKWSKSSSS